MNPSSKMNCFASCGCFELPGLMTLHHLVRQHLKQLVQIRETNLPTLNQERASTSGWQVGDISKALCGTVKCSPASSSSKDTSKADSTLSTSCWLCWQSLDCTLNARVSLCCFPSDDSGPASCSCTVVAMLIIIIIIIVIITISISFFDTIIFVIMFLILIVY